MQALDIHDLYFRYAGAERNTINGAELHVAEGEIVALTGTSGCGKSTLCLCAAALAPRLVPGKLMGSVELFGKDAASLDAAERAASVGIVFQEPDGQLFSPLTEQEIAFAPENLCLSQEDIGRRIEDALEMVGMSGYRFSPPDRLSGGQKQLIALAAVIAMRPKLYILDETMSQLDKDAVLRIKDVICRLKDTGASVLMVEHDSAKLDVADRIVKMSKGKIGECAGGIY